MRRYYITIALLLALVTGSYAQTSCAATATSYIERGNKWLEKGEWSHAIEDFSLAISFDLQSASAYFQQPPCVADQVSSLVKNH